MEHKKCEKKTHLIGGIVVVVILLLIISFQLGSINKKMSAVDSKLGTLENFFNGIPLPSEPTPTPEPHLEPSAPLVDMKGIMDDDALKGSADAPVTIVEFSDYECPFCTRFYKQTLGQIEEEYIKTGKVKFVYRDFPLGFHANAQKAAEAAECADEQGKYFDMHNMLFEKGVTGGVASFKQFANDIGLNTKEFNECLDSGKMEDEVKKDIIDGSALGITGTPGFIINGKLVSGAQPFSVFKQVIEEELAK